MLDIRATVAFKFRATRNSFKSSEDDPSPSDEEVRAAILDRVMSFVGDLVLPDCTGKNYVVIIEADDPPAEDA